MKLLLSYESHNLLVESCNTFETELDNVLNEKMGDVLGSPIKYLKIKNNAKKYQKALVNQALNDIDYAKKKAKTKGQRTKEETEVLNQANKAKNAQLGNQATTIGMRMDNLASNDGLKKVATLAKSKAKVAAAEIAIKAADETENKILQVRIKKQQQKAKDAQQALKDYESEAKNNPDGTSDAATATTVPEKPPGKKEIDAMKANIESLKKKSEQIENLIKKQKEAGNDDTVKKAEKMLSDRKSELENAQKTLDKATKKADESTFISQYYYLLETLDELEGDLEILKRSLDV